jgi:7-cyano-7-deazaguanine synthase in queuosine biosynthesis
VVTSRTSRRSRVTWFICTTHHLIMYLIFHFGRRHRASVLCNGQTVESISSSLHTSSNIINQVLFRSYEPVDTQKIVQTVIPPLYVPGGHDTFLAVGVARAQCMAQTRLICSIDQKYFIIILAVISNTTEYMCFMFAASMLVVHNIYGHTIRQGVQCPCRLCITIP